MDPLFLLFMFFLFFLAGVGVGTFVLGSRIRAVVAEAILYARSIDGTVAADIKVAGSKFASIESKIAAKVDKIKKVF
jgi:hypothetical protein